MGVAELSAGRVAWARDAEAMSRLTIVTFTLISTRWFSPTLKSITFIHRLPGLSSVLLDSSSMVFVVGEGKLSQEKIALVHG